MSTNSPVNLPCTCTIWHDAHESKKAFLANSSALSSPRKLSFWIQASVFMQCLWSWLGTVYTKKIQIILKGLNSRQKFIGLQNEEKIQEGYEPSRKQNERRLTLSRALLAYQQRAKHFLQTGCGQLNGCREHCLFLQGANVYRHSWPSLALVQTSCLVHCLR